MCRGNTTSAADLRHRLDAFGAVPEPLEGLDRVTWLADLLNGKLESREYDFIRSHYEAICFLEAQFGVCANTSMVDGWVLAATTGLRDVSGLNSSPMFVTTDAMVIVCGSIVALSDISKYLSKHPDISLNRFLVMATNSFNLDCNITLRGGLLAVFAPNWSCITASKDTGPVIVDLTGLDEVGQDKLGFGLPGGPGGVFIGRGCRFNNLEGNLVVLTHGGRGAAGLDGNKGTDGGNGKDASVPKGGYPSPSIKLRAGDYFDLLWNGDRPNYDNYDKPDFGPFGPSFRNRVNDTPASGMIMLGEDKCLMAIRGKRGDVIDMLAFQVYDINTKTAHWSHSHGGGGGGDFAPIYEANCEIVGFDIRIGPFKNHFPIVHDIRPKFHKREKNDQTKGKPGSQGDDGRAGGYGGKAGFARIRGKIGHF